MRNGTGSFFPSLGASSRGDADEAREDDAEDAVPSGPSDVFAFAAASVVIWDVDGTLADSTQLGFTSTNAVLVEAGIGAITLGQYMQGTRYATPQRLAWHATGDISATCGAELGAAFDRHYLALVSPTSAGFFPGVASLVKRIAASGKAQAVLSNACGAYARAVVEVNGVAEYMTRVDGADEVPAVKPAPDGLLAQCAALGWEPKVSLLRARRVPVCPCVGARHGALN